MGNDQSALQTLGHDPQNHLYSSYRTHPHTNSGFTQPASAEPLPRGLQIMATSTNRLLRGFPYPKEALLPYGVTKADWKRFCRAISSPLVGGMRGLDYGKIAYRIEDVLDLVVSWDTQLFRPKGLVMRMDMPGEQKYGLYFMDLYHDHHIDNFLGTGSRISTIKEHNRNASQKKKNRHLADVKEEAFCSTRIVLDPIEVLEDEQKSEARGWTAWNKACKEAQLRRAQKPDPVPISTEPWTVVPPPRVRNDRWPASKHFYYERFRGRPVCVPSGSGNTYSPCSGNCHFIPDHDSMDQRGGSHAHPARILPVDEMPYQVVHRDPFESSRKK